MNLIIGIIAIYIIYKLAKGAMANEKPDQLTQAAQSADCTKLILKTLERVTTARVDEVHWNLSVDAPASPGKEYIKAIVTFRSETLAVAYAGAVEERRRAIRKCVEQRLNSRETSALTEPIGQWVKDTFTDCFAGTEEVDELLMFPFVENYYNDRVVTIDRDTVSGWLLFAVGDLGIDTSKNDLPRAPFVIEAVAAEAKKRFPNMTISADKSIPTK